MTVSSISSPLFNTPIVQPKFGRRTAAAKLDSVRFGAAAPTLSKMENQLNVKMVDARKAFDVPADFPDGAMPKDDSLKLLHEKFANWNNTKASGASLAEFKEKLTQAVVLYAHILGEENTQSAIDDLKAAGSRFEQRAWKLSDTPDEAELKKALNDKVSALGASPTPDEINSFFEQLQSLKRITNASTSAPHKNAPGVPNSSIITRTRLAVAAALVALGIGGTVAYKRYHSTPSDSTPEGASNHNSGSEGGQNHVNRDSARRPDNGVHRRSDGTHRRQAGNNEPDTNPIYYTQTLYDGDDFRCKRDGQEEFFPGYPQDHGYSPAIPYQGNEGTVHALRRCAVMQSTHPDGIPVGGFRVITKLGAGEQIILGNCDNGEVLSESPAISLCPAGTVPASAGNLVATVEREQRPSE